MLCILIEGELGIGAKIGEMCHTGQKWCCFTIMQAKQGDITFLLPPAPPDLPSPQTAGEAGRYGSSAIEPAFGNGVNCTDPLPLSFAPTHWYNSQPNQK